MNLKCKFIILNWGSVMKKIDNAIDSTCFYYTNKCNITCGHCISKCTPKKKGKLELKKTVEWLKDLAEMKIKSAGFSGGEPLIFFDEITCIISKAKKLGLNVGLLTNGTWAKNWNSTTRTLKGLNKSGLDKLEISIDEFHQKYVPIKNISNILDASKKFSKPEIALRLTKTGDHEYLKILFLLLEKIGKTKIFLQALFPYGRAKKLNQRKFLINKRASKCRCECLNLPIVDVDGSVYICSQGQLLGKKSIYFLGNALEKPLKEIFQEFKESKLVYFLKNLGPEKLFKKIGRETKSNKGYVGLCHYCLENSRKIKKQALFNALEKFEPVT